MESSSWKYHCEPQVKVGIVSGVTIHFALNGPYTVLGRKAVGAQTVEMTPHGIVTASGERVFFLIQPDNLSVLSPEVIRGRVRSLTMLLSTQPTLEILALDSRESFQRNKEYYLRRLEEETEPAVRELLERDMAHLDAIQFSSASSRKFVLVLPLDEKAGADESALRQLEKAICDHGLRVRLAEEQDVKRLLAIYYRQDLTTEVFRDFDGEEYVHG